MNESSHPRPGCGADPIDAELAAWQAEESAQHAQAAEAVQALAPIYAIQQMVAARYEAEVLEPRKKIWDDMVYVLGDTLPVRAVLNYYQRRDGMLHSFKISPIWKFWLPDTQNNMNIYTTVECKDSLSQPESLLAARYIVGDKTVTVPESLLGMSAVGGRWRKKIPPESLRFKLAQEAAMHTQELQLAVHATRMGVPDDSRTLLKTRVFRYRPARDEYYLQPEHAEGILIDIGQGYYAHGEHYEAVAEPDSEDVLDCLVRRYCQDGIGEDYEKLAAVNNYISRSTPVLPGSSS